MNQITIPAVNLSSRGQNKAIVQRAVMRLTGLLSEGHAYATIADKLNYERLYTATGKRWQADTIEYVLRSLRQGKPSVYMVAAKAAGIVQEASA